jgi:hypothetical protein
MYPASWKRNQFVWMRERLCGRRYSPTVDQPSLAAAIDLRQARGAPSFDKLWREVERLIRHRSIPSPGIYTGI